MLPDDPPLQIHQLRVKDCPISFPCGYYWYSKKRSRPGWPPKWVEKLMNQPPSIPGNKSNETVAYHVVDHMNIYNPKVHTIQYSYCYTYAYTIQYTSVHVYMLHTPLSGLDP